MHTKTFLFSNGDEVKEKITGFTGVITGTAFYLTGCNSYLIVAKPKDEFSEPTSLWYDEGRLDLVSKKFTEDDVKAVDNGCDILPAQGRKGN